MVINIKKLFLPFALLLAMQLCYSQFSFSNEIGVIVGPVAYQSDFGERYDYETNSGNTGIGIGIVHYMNFDYRSGYNYYSPNNYFSDHFKVRTEISWNKTSLNHFGKWVDEDRTSEGADKLRAHSGESQNWDIGMQLEYYPMSIKAFSAGINAFAPFASLGVHYVSFNPVVETTYGDLNIDNPNNFFPAWEPGSVTDQSGSTFSLVGSIGTRYKLTILSDLMIDLRIQSFFDDTTDGLDHQLSSNKTNDWLVWLNFGYIYYLN
jgi:hypothetical protein